MKDIIIFKPDGREIRIPAKFDPAKMSYDKLKKFIEDLTGKPVDFAAQEETEDSWGEDWTPEDDE